MNKKIDDDDFFGDILGDENEDSSFEINNEDEEFDFETDEIDNDEPPFEIETKPKKYKEDKYARTKDDIQDSVAELQGSINSMLKTIDKKPDDMFPDKDLLPGLDLQVDIHDYEKDLELIKIESKETLECLANLYLTEETMKTRNVYKIIKDDSSLLSKLNFSIEMGQKALISVSRQLDMGVNDPLMYQAVTMFMKEIRDNVSKAYDLQRKMKDFYKELKTELQEINAGEETITEQDDHYTIIGDPRMLNDLFEKMKDDPSLLQEMLDKKKKK